jgi:hypothetical protein
MGFKVQPESPRGLEGHGWNRNFEIERSEEGMAE